MTINLTPPELQYFVDQVLTVLRPSFEKGLQAASKASSEQLQCLTVAEVAKRLRCHGKTVLKYIEDGRLRAANTGDNPKRPQYRVSEADLASFYKAHRMGR